MDTSSNTMTNMREIINVSEETKEFHESPHETVQHHDPILDDEARRVLEVIFYSALGGAFAVLGSTVNVINIIVFVKQGFSDSVSISLCALAVSDLGFLLPMMWISICTNPLFQNSDLSFDTSDIHYITGAMPHSCFVRITTLITVFITFERCVCIALPLKVKNIITPRRTLVSIGAMYAIVFTANIPMFSSIYLAPSFRAKRNKTLVGLKYTSNTKIFADISCYFNAFVQVISVILVIICTVILVLKVFAKSEWRHQAISVSDVSHSISTRDKRVISMVTFISISFIICYFPSAINLMLMVYLYPEYSANGQYINWYHVSWSVISTLEGINSSVTILIYYNMSSKFRATFIGLFTTTKSVEKR